MDLHIEIPIKAPIYAYYQLDNFYQNHRRYVKSRNDDQLKGNYMTVEELDSCEPVKTNSDLGLDYAFDGITLLDPEAPAYPCGLVAKSLFNDTLSLF